MKGFALASSAPGVLEKVQINQEAQASCQAYLPELFRLFISLFRSCAMPDWL
jgi:hypothetical protein